MIPINEHLTLLTRNGPYSIALCKNPHINSNLAIVRFYVLSFVLILQYSSHAQDTLRLANNYVKAEVDAYVDSIDVNVNVVVLYINLYPSQSNEEMVEGKSVQIFHAGRDSITTYHYFANGQVQDITLQKGIDQLQTSWYEHKHLPKDSIAFTENHSYWIRYSEKGRMEFILIEDSLANNMFYSQYYTPEYAIVSNYSADCITTSVWNQKNNKLILTRKQNVDTSTILEFQLYDKSGHKVFTFKGETKIISVEGKVSRPMKRWRRKHDSLLYLFQRDGTEE